jgi:hypothetical protein
MRGDWVGVGDIGAVHDGARGSGDASCGDDGRGAVRQRDHGILDGHWQGKRDEGIQQGGDRDGIGDGARGEHGACCFHCHGAVRADGMRGDSVGVGDIGAVQGGARGSGDTACGDDGRGAIRQRDRGILDGHWQGERDEGIQQGGDRVGVCDSARGWFWRCCFHGDGAVRADGMRGDRVGVGDIGTVQGGSWGSWDAWFGDDSWITN